MANSRVSLYGSIVGLFQTFLHTEWNKCNLINETNQHYLQARGNQKCGEDRALFLQLYHNMFFLIEGYSKISVVQYFGQQISLPLPTFPYPWVPCDYSRRSIEGFLSGCSWFPERPTEFALLSLILGSNGIILECTLSAGIILYFINQSPTANVN